MMHLLGCGQEHESVSALFKVLDTDGDGLISREEFIAGFEKLRVAESSEVVLKAKLRLSDEEYAEFPDLMYAKVMKLIVDIIVVG